MGRPPSSWSGQINQSIKLTFNSIKSTNYLQGIETGVMATVGCRKLETRDRMSVLHSVLVHHQWLLALLMDNNNNNQIKADSW